MLKKIGVVVTTLLLLAIVVWPVLSSRTVQSCVNPQPATSRGDHRDAAAKSVDDLIGIGTTYGRCVSVYIVKENAAITALSTLFLAFITCGLVWVAVDQGRTSRAQLRAYVSASPYWITSFSETHLATARFRLKNHGVTPAMEVIHRSRIVALKWPFKEAAFPELTGDFSPALVIFPSAEFSGYSTQSVCFTAAEIADILAKTKRVYIYGEVYYRDAFQRQRRTEFCTSVTGADTDLEKLSSNSRDHVDLTYDTAPWGNNAT